MRIWSVNVVSVYSSYANGVVVHSTTLDIFMWGRFSELAKVIKFFKELHVH